MNVNSHVVCALVAVGLSAGGACVKAPDIVLTDRHTALEQQAAGEFRALENDLHRANITPKGEDITREALEADNPERGTTTLGEVAQLYSSAPTDSGWIDRQLVRGCIGEALSGLLEPTPQYCDDELDKGQLTRVVERANLHRRQLWRVMHERDRSASEADIRAAWRKVHLARVVCHALIQTDDGAWQPKNC